MVDIFFFFFELVENTQDILLYTYDGNFVFYLI